MHVYGEVEHFAIIFLLKVKTVQDLFKLVKICRLFIRSKLSHMDTSSICFKASVTYKLSRKNWHDQHCFTNLSA